MTELGAAIEADIKDRPDSYYTKPEVEVLAPIRSNSLKEIMVWFSEPSAIGAKLGIVYPKVSAKEMADFMKILNEDEKSDLKSMNLVA